MGKLRDDVLLEIRRRIVRGDYKPGQLFSENDLLSALKDLKISRQPIREAFAVLAQEGLIEQIPRKGVSVRFISMTETREILRLRKSLELVVVGVLAMSTLPDRLAGVEEVLKNMDQAVLDQDIGRFLDLDAQFHSLLAENGGFSTAAYMLGTLRDKLRIMGLDEVERSRDLTKYNQQHWDIYHAIGNRDPARAKGMLEQHVDATARHLLGEVTDGLPEKEKEVAELVEKARNMRRTGTPLTEVIGVLEEAVEKIQQSTELHSEHVQALLELSTTRRLQREFTTAEKHALEALHLSELHQDKPGQAWANYELARIALDDREPMRPNDVTLLDTAEKMYENLRGTEQDKRRGWTYYAQALRHRNESPDKALRYAKNALEVFDRSGERYGKAQTLDLLGAIAGSTEGGEVAQRWFKEARTIAGKEGYRPVLASTSFHEASTLEHRSDVEAELQQALQLFKEMQHAPGMIAAHDALCTLETASLEDRGEGDDPPFVPLG